MLALAKTKSWIVTTGLNVHGHIVVAAINEMFAEYIEQPVIWCTHELYIHGNS
jgi:hypothetical protein